MQIEGKTTFLRPSKRYKVDEFLFHDFCLALLSLGYHNNCDPLILRTKPNLLIGKLSCTTPCNHH